jgi:hypothetical protein
MLESIRRRLWKRALTTAVYDRTAQAIARKHATILDDFENLYDTRSGGWHIPAQWETPFRSELVPVWLAANPPRTSPIEREVGHFLASLERFPIRMHHIRR